MVLNVRKEFFIQIRPDKNEVFVGHTNPDKPLTKTETKKVFVRKFTKTFFVSVFVSVFVWILLFLF